MKTIVLYLGNRLECGGGKIKSQGNHLIQLFLRTWYHARRVLEAYMFHVKKCRPLKVNMEATNHPFRKEHDLNQTFRELCAFHVNLQGSFPVQICNLALLGGWTNPIWKICSSTWIITPRFGLKIKHIGNHYTPEIEHSPWKIMIGRWVSFWNCLSLGASCWISGVYLVIFLQSYPYLLDPRPTPKAPQ